eukprot:3888868-Heterocapsa_arctica.AAC.1
MSTCSRARRAGPGAQGGSGVGTGHSGLVPWSGRRTEPGRKREVLGEEAAERVMRVEPGRKRVPRVGWASNEDGDRTTGPP